MPQPSELASAASLVSLGLLCVLVLRKIVLMDRLHELRVLLLAALLWAAVFYLFCLALDPPATKVECPEPEGGRRYFCISET